jgi:phosphatidylglycerophosphatase A
LGEHTQTSTDRVVLLLATGGGLGDARWMPGTVGSLWGPPLVWLWQLFGWPLWSNAVLGAVLFAAGIPLCKRASELMQAKDPGRLVFDEIAAFPFIFLFVPVTWASAVFGFFWFRLFDILKPWPCTELDHMHNAFGVMGDDTAAALYAAVALVGSMAMWNGLG